MQMMGNMLSHISSGVNYGHRVQTVHDNQDMFHSHQNPHLNRNGPTMGETLHQETKKKLIAYILHHYKYVAWKQFSVLSQSFTLQLTEDIITLGCLIDVPHYLLFQKFFSHDIFYSNPLPFTL